MRAFSLTSLVCFCFFVDSIDAQLDGQISCAWGKSGRSKRSALKWLASSSVNEKDVNFLLYNKDRLVNDNPYSVQVFIDDDSSLQTGDFDPKKLTKIFIHGYKSHYNKSASRLVRDGFLNSGDFNVIIVDWSKAQHKYGILWPYEIVVKKLDAVAEHVSRFLAFIERYGVDLNQTTIVAHSLGAHIAGLASYIVRSRIGRLVGLDPAGPLMSKKSAYQRLSKEAAIQVEVIHSEIDQCGLNIQMGHYDFYPNSGRDQPGCSTYHCSHARSYRYFAESLDPQSKGFYGRLCEDWWSMQQGNCSSEVAVMGGLLTKSAPEGIYYVKTNAVAPFAQGREAITT